MGTLQEQDVVQALLAISVILFLSHTFGFIFRRLKMPSVFGELLAGIILGKTVLSYVLPQFQAFIFPNIPAVNITLSILYNFGLLLLMFCSGLEFRTRFESEEKTTIISITLSGLIIPFLIGFFIVNHYLFSNWWGENANLLSFSLVFAIAVSVTSIPVISRIFSDLGVLNSSLARIVISAAVIEDIILYIFLSLALSLAAQTTSQIPILEFFNIQVSGNVLIALHVFFTIIFFVLAKILSPLFFKIENFRFNIFKKGNPIAFLLVFTLFTVLIGYMIGINPIMSSFAAGIIAKSFDTDPESSREITKKFSYAFFIPIYFCLVGMRLDLIKNLEIINTILFISAASIIKFVSVYLGSTLAKRNSKESFLYSIAMNARGGPGIVLASVAFNALIINEKFFTTLIVLSVSTSILAGVILGRLKEKIT